jgi:hypothetical protein
MEILNTAINAAVVAAVGLLLSLQARGRFREMEKRLDRLEAKLDGSVDSLRADLLRVALAVGARPPVETGS